MSKKKVILYGISNEFDVENIFYSMKPCYEMLGISDQNREKGEKLAAKLQVKYYKPQEISGGEVDIIYVTTKGKDTYSRIVGDLTFNKKIPREKIFYYTDFYREIKLELGEKNPDKIIYVLRRTYAKMGMFALLMHYLPCLINLTDDVEIFVDMQNYRSVYHKDDEVGKKNVWEYWFKQPCNMSIEDVYESKNVILAPTEEWAVCMRQPEPMLQVHKEAFSRLSLNAEMEKLLEIERKKVFGNENTEKVCAVIYRGSDYLRLKPYHHFIMPDIENLIQKVKELRDEWGFKKIYLVTEDTSGLKYFEKEFPNNVYMSERELIDNYPVTASELISAIHNITFQRENDEFLKGMEYLRQIYIAAECDYIIAGQSGGTRGAMFIAEEFEKSYLFDMGIYGEDDDSYATPFGHYVLIEEEKKLREMREHMN